MTGWLVVLSFISHYISTLLTLQLFVYIGRLTWTPLMSATWTVSSSSRRSMLASPKHRYVNIRRWTSIIRTFRIFHLVWPRAFVLFFSTPRYIFLLVVLQVAKESALQFCPTANITAYHDSIMKWDSFYYLLVLLIKEVNELYHTETQTYQYS